jgi:hypothetical protein
VRITEIDVDSGLDGEVRVVGHLFSLVPGNAFAEELGKVLHLLGQEGRDALGGPVVRDSHEHGESAGTLDQGRDLRLAAFADDQISLPEAGNRAVLGLDRTLADVDHFSDLSPGHDWP